MTEFSRKLTPFILFPKFQLLAETSTCETIAMIAVKKPMSITELDRKEVWSFFACRVARPNTKAKTSITLTKAEPKDIQSVSSDQVVLNKK